MRYRVPSVHSEGWVMTNRFPPKGRPREEVLDDLESAKSDDVDWRGGRIGLYTHFGGDDVLEVAKDAARMYFSENALGPSAFPSLARFENDVIDWTLGLLNGGDDAAGSMTSGGTESIIMAAKTARDWSREKRPAVDVPVIVAPYSAHPAFNKAAHYLGMEVVRIPIGEDYRADVNRMAGAIDERTVMLVGSTPQFAHGVIDPIEDLAQVALDRDLWLHVDACVGGFIAPFARELGRPVPPFDFSVPGVTSMSADLHKYGFTAKGASTFLICDQALREHQVFEFDDWSRGHYSSATVPGTRPGGPIAAAWAVLNYLGWDGYLRIAGELFEAIDRLKAGIRSIEGLSIIGDPPLTIVTYTSEGCDIFAVAEAMTQRGWFITRSADPRAIHMGMLTMTHVPVVDQYLSDLAEAVDEAKRGKIESFDETVSYGG